MADLPAVSIGPPGSVRVLWKPGQPIPENLRALIEAKRHIWQGREETPA